MKKNIRGIISHKFGLEITVINGRHNIHSVLGTDLVIDYNIFLDEILIENLDHFIETKYVHR